MDLVLSNIMMLAFVVLSIWSSVEKDKNKSEILVYVSNVIAVTVYMGLGSYMMAGIIAINVIRHIFKNIGGLNKNVVLVSYIATILVIFGCTEKYKTTELKLVGIVVGLIILIYTVIVTDKDTLKIFKNMGDTTKNILSVIWTLSFVVYDIEWQVYTTSILYGFMTICLLNVVIQSILNRGKTKGTQK